MIRGFSPSPPDLNPQHMFARNHPSPPAEFSSEPEEKPYPFPRSGPEPDREPEPGLVELIPRLFEDLRTWITLEGDLARSELSEKYRAALRGLVVAATGLALFLCGGLAMLLATGFGVSGLLARAGVDPAFSHALGFLASGLVGALAGWFAMDKARAILSPARLLPSRTTTALRRALHLHQPHDENEQNPPSP